MVLFYPNLNLHSLNTYYPAKLTLMERGFIRNGYVELLQGCSSKTHENMQPLHTPLAFHGPPAALHRSSINGCFSHSVSHVVPRIAEFNAEGQDHTFCIYCLLKYT